MGMIPKRRSRLIDLQDWSPRTASGNELLWSSVNVARHQETVPVHGRDTVERVFNGHLNFFTTT
jgi:hypothetical protein